MVTSTSSKNQVSHSVLTIFITIINLSEPCKSRKPEAIAPSSDISPDGHPLDWTDKIHQETITDVRAASPHVPKSLGQEYIHHIRMANRSLNLILENFNAQTYTDSPQGPLTTMLGLATSQKKIKELFEIASAIFPSNLDSTVDAMARSHADN